MIGIVAQKPLISDIELAFDHNINYKFIHQQQVV